MLNMLRRIAGNLTRTLIRWGRQNRQIRYWMDEITLTEIFQTAKAASGHARWQKLDSIYSRARRELNRTPGWRFGSPRVLEVITEIAHELGDLNHVTNSVYCDLGCGSYHPFGISVVMYLNGAERTIALDNQEFDRIRASEALFDLLCDCFSSPDNWHFGINSRDEYLERIQAFNLAALKMGDLENGIKSVPINHFIADIHSDHQEIRNIDLMCSRGVLEHFMDLPRAIYKMYEMLNPGGLAFHHIDLVDHRAYIDPNRFHYWSFLTEDDDWSDGLVNRLRAGEILEVFISSGFEVLSYRKTLGEVPVGLSKKLSKKFQKMPEEDIRCTKVLTTLKKPDYFETA